MTRYDYTRETVCIASFVSVLSQKKDKYVVSTIIRIDYGFIVARRFVARVHRAPHPVRRPTSRRRVLLFRFFERFRVTGYF